MVDDDTSAEYIIFHTNKIRKLGVHDDPHGTGTAAEGADAHIGFLQKYYEIYAKNLFQKLI